MKKNMGAADRVIRILVAIVFFALFFTHAVTGVAGWVLMAAGAIFLLTAFANFCPLYTLLGVHTNRKKS